MARAGTAFIDFEGNFAPMIAQSRVAGTKVGRQFDDVGTDAGSRFGRSFSVAMDRARTGAVGALTRGVQGAGIGAALFGGTALKLGFDRLTTIEDATVSLTTIMGDATAAGGLMDDILKVVTGTPFNLDQFATAGRNLVTFGVDADKVPRYLTAIGEAAAASGAGAEGVDSITEAFGRIAATGQVSLDEVWNISDSGANALGILANGFGVTTDDMKTMISEGAVPSARALDLLADGIINGSDGAAGATVALGGSMEDLRQTTSGALGGARTAMARFGAAILEPFVGALPNALGGFSDILDRMGEAWPRLLDRAEPVLGFLRDNMVPILGGLGVIVAGLVGPAILGGLVTVITTIGAVLLGPIGLIAALAAGAVYAYQNFLPFRQIVDEIIALFRELPSVFRAEGFEGVIRRISEKFAELWPRIRAVLSQLAFSLWAWIQEQAPILWAKFQSWARAFYEWISPMIPPFLAAMGVLAQRLWEWIVMIAPGVRDRLWVWARAFWEWISPMIPPFLAALGRLWVAFATWMVETVYPALLEKLRQWGGAFLAWIGPLIPPFLVELGKLWAKFAEWMATTVYPALVAKLAEWGVAFGNWVVTTAIPWLIVKLGELWLRMAAWMVTTAYPALLEKLRQWGIAFGDWVVTTAIPWLIAKLGELWLRMAAWMVTVAYPAIVAKLLEWARAFADWVWTSAVPWLLLKLTEMQRWFGTWIVGTALPWIKEKLLEWARAFADWVTESGIPWLIAKLIQLKDAVIRWFTDTALPAFKQKLTEWARAFADWVSTEALPWLMEKLRGLKDSMLRWLGETLGTVKDELFGMARAVGDGIAGIVGAAFDKVPGAISGALRIAGDVVAGFLRGAASIADAIGLGSIADGLRSGAATADGWGSNIGAGGGGGGRTGGPTYYQASGGEVPGRVGGGFKTDGPVAVVGEGRRQYPEFVIPTDPQYRGRALGLWESAGAKLMDRGGVLGIVDDVRNAPGAVVDWGREAAADIAGVARRIIAGAVEALPPGKLPVPNNLTGVVPGAFNKLREKIIEVIRGKADEENAKAEMAAGSLTGAGFTGGGGGGPAGRYTPAMQTARSDVLAAFGNMTVGGYVNRNIAGTNQLSDHARWRAWDFMVGMGAVPRGNGIANLLLQRAQQYGLKYLIWNAQRNSGSGWGPYRHPSGSNDNTLMHRDHVHASFFARGGVLPGFHSGGRIGEDERGFNWRTMGNRRAGPAIAKAFPNGLIGDLNQSGRISDKEWWSWNVFGAQMRRNSAATLRYLQAGRRATGGVLGSEPLTVHRQPFDLGGVLKPGWNAVRNDLGGPERLTRERSGPAVEFTGPVNLNDGVDIDLLSNKLGFRVAAKGL